MRAVASALMVMVAPQLAAQGMPTFWATMWFYGWTAATIYFLVNP